MKPTVPSFPAILATLSIESYVEIPALKTNYFLEKKLNLETIFSYSRIKHVIFKNSLSSERFPTSARSAEEASTTFVPASHKESNISFLHSKWKILLLKVIYFVKSLRFIRSACSFN